MVNKDGRGVLPKTAIIAEFIDPQVTVQGNLHGKVEQNRFVELDFTKTV